MKKKVDDSWYDELKSADYTKDNFQWLSLFRENNEYAVDTVVNFGCAGEAWESLALLWALDASEITVVDIEKSHIDDEFRKSIQRIQSNCDGCLDGRDIVTRVGDVTKLIERLPDNYFDLSYCCEFLHSLIYYEALNQRPDMWPNVEYAIEQMIRVTKPGGIIIAVEGKFGVREALGENAFIQQIKSSDKGYYESLDPYFRNAGLIQISVPNEFNPPSYLYCYRKMTLK